MTFKKTIKSSLVALFAAAAVGLTFGGSSAQAQPYVEGITGTSTTPQFNIFTGVPVTGNESDFVRLRKSNGDPTSSAATNQFINELSAACNVGDKFDIRSYVHNGASPNSNDNGNGTAVARNTTISLTASLGGNSDRFVFGSTISASNAGSVSDTGFLNCSENVRLKLVPNTIHSSAAGVWVDRSDTAVNGTMPIGSRNATNGELWACWDERVMVVYTVEIVEIPVEVPDPVYTCDLLSVVAINNRKFKFTTNATAKNGAVAADYTYNFGDGNSKTVSGSNMVEHTYEKSGDYKSTVTVGFSVTQDGATTRQTATSVDCEKTIKVDIKAPVYACEMFKLTLSGRKATVTFLPVASNGATFKDATIVFKADGSIKQKVVTNNKNDDGKVGSVHTYDDKAKSLVATVAVRFNVGDEVKEVACGASAVLGAATTKVLPDTGAGSIVGLLAAVTIAGAVAHRTFVLTRS
jgi:hypothetical protein